MRNLLDFLYKYHHWLVFIVLEVVSVVLLFQYNSYQNSVWFSTASAMAGKVYELESKMTAYLSMAKENEELTMRNLYQERQLDQLRFSHRKGTDPCGRGNVKMIPVEQFPDDPDHFGVVQHRQTFFIKFPPQKDIFINRQIFGQIQFLIEHGNARVQRRFRIREPDLAAVQQDGAVVLLVHPREDLHQGRFARAVFPAESVDHARSDRERHIAKRLHRAETLGNMLHPQFFQF